MNNLEILNNTFDRWNLRNTAIDLRAKMVDTAVSGRRNAEPLGAAFRFYGHGSECRPIRLHQKMEYSYEITDKSGHHRRGDDGSWLALPFG